MYGNLKTLSLASITCLSIFVLTGPAFAGDMSSSSQIEDIQESQNKKKTMQTKSWNTPKPKEEKADKNDEGESDTKGEENVADAESEEDLTEEQKVWKKYQELAQGNKDAKEQASEEEVASVEDTEPVDVNEEDVTEEAEKQSHGMAGILERYKKAQENKGELTTRSFGSID